MTDGCVFHSGPVVCVVNMWKGHEVLHAAVFVSVFERVSVRCTSDQQKHV